MGLSGGLTVGARFAFGHDLPRFFVILDNQFGSGVLKLQFFSCFYYGLPLFHHLLYEILLFLSDWLVTLTETLMCVLFSDEKFQSIQYNNYIDRGPKGRIYYFFEFLGEEIPGAGQQVGTFPFIAVYY